MTSGNAKHRWLGPIIIAIVGGIMMIRSWGTWPDCVTDFGRELYVPWQIGEGKVLYRDIVSYFNGPLSPHVHALLFKLFGASLQTLVIFNLLVIALIATLLYALLVRFTGRIGATAGGVVFLVLFAFAQLRFTGNYNFVCPYSYELTHGIALTLAAIWCLTRWMESDRRAWLIACGAMLGLVALTKAEVFLAALAAVTTGVVVRAWIKGLSWRDVIGFLAAATAPVVIAFLLLITQLSASDALKGMAGSWRWLGDRELLDLPYFKDLAGTRDIGQSLRIIAVWSIGYLIVFGLPAIVGVQMRTRSTPVSTALFIVLLVAGVLIAARITWDDFLRPVPLALLGAIVFMIRAMPKRRDAAAPLVLPLVLLIWSLMLLAKIGLNAHIHHYGFALAMPATVIAAAMLIGWLPRLIDERGGNGNLLRAAAVALVVIVLIVHVRVMEGFWASKDVLVGAGRDAFQADWRGHVVNQMTQQIARGTPPDATLAVVPEGLILNYLTRRENPTGQLNFTPPAVIMYGEDRMLAAFQQRPPDYAVLAGVDTAEYGPRFFGTDYAQPIGAWLQAKYVVVSRVGPRPFQEPGFGMVLMKRDATPK